MLSTPASFGPQSVATLASLAGAVARWGSLGAVATARRPIAGRLAALGKPGRFAPIHQPTTEVGWERFLTQVASH